jgi:hypothetical protein
MEILRGIFLYNFHWSVMGMCAALGYGIWNISQKVKKGEPLGRGDIRYFWIFTIIWFVWALVVGLYFSVFR